MAKKAKRKSTSAGARPVLQFRVHQGLYDALTDRAVKNQRSISEEANDILSKWLGERELFPGIQQVAMLAASAFWHAGQAANGFEGYSSTDWMKNPACYRAAWHAAAITLLGPLLAKENQNERDLAFAGLINATDRLEQETQEIESFFERAKRVGDDK
jgi:hypothetical protein